MKKTHFYFPGLMMLCSLAACNGGAGTTGSSDSTKMNPGDSSVTTSTTTTTVHHKYSGTFVPKPDVKYMDLRTHKEVTVRIDTIKGAVVNSETDEPMDLFVAPNTHDTIYGMTGTVVNNYIIKDDSGYRVDTVRINTVEVQTVTPEPNPEPAAMNGKYKEKDNGNKKKFKNDEEKIKEQNGVIKVKDR